MANQRHLEIQVTALERLLKLSDPDDLLKVFMWRDESPSYDFWVRTHHSLILGNQLTAIDVQYIKPILARKTVELSALTQGAE